MPASKTPIDAPLGSPRLARVPRDAGASAVARTRPGAMCAIMTDMADEESQELGREGVGMVKAWLESTTWLELPMNAYEDKHRCKVQYAPDKVKKFDLRGNFIGQKRPEV